ncbi:MAG TPA: Xaa-Pro peptidase family protein [Gemmatimonadota bacterium]|jgi:Xaa-Pro aminopeptidase
MTSASPTTSFDYAGRIERAREALARRGAAGLALTPGPNLRYLTGVAAGPSERLLLLLAPAQGPRILIAPAFEGERLAGEARVELELDLWDEGQDPFARAAGRISSGAWLIGPETPFGVAARLQERGARLLSGEDLLGALRRRKDAEEIDGLARAQALTRQALDHARRSLETGVCERELAAEIVRWLTAAGAGGWALVQFGEGSALPHGAAGSRLLERESAVLVDLGAIVEGYHGDLTRSWWHGERAAAAYLEAQRAVEEAHARAAALARPGARAGDLDRAAREHLAAGDLARWFTHRLGHGIGLEIHEPPYLVGESAVTLEAGDVFTIEPGVYLPGRFGVRHEDVYALVGDGFRRL